MSLLHCAAEQILRLWKENYLQPTGHAGATVEVVQAMQTLENGLREAKEQEREQFFGELPC